MSMIFNAVAGGGGASLNFKVIGNPQPAAAAENTIWVNTDIKITGYDFNATEPADPIEGMAWFSVGTSSPVEFNALKKNGVQVYPLSAKQYVNGAWVDKDAKSYQNGEWVDWVVYLFNNGNQFESVTGGWTLNGYTHQSIPLTSATYDGEKLIFVGISGQHQVLGTDDAISLSDKNKIRVVGEVTSVYSANGAVFGLVLSVLTTKSFSNPVAELAMNKVEKFDYTLDISGLDGDYYIVIRSEAAPGCDGYVTEVGVS